MTIDTTRRDAGFTPPRAVSRARLRGAASAIFGAALFVGGSAAAQSCIAEEGLTVLQDGFIPAYAVTRPGPIIFVNQDQGAGLGRETQAWLLERQCYLAANHAASAVPSPDGILEFSPGAHEDADCEAFERVVAAEGGRATVVRVIDRDVSRQQRGDYWDIGMGEDIRPIASANCR